MRRSLRFLAALVSSLLLAAAVAPPATALPDWRTTNSSWTNPDARRAGSLHLGGRVGVEHFLELEVEVAGAEHAPVHRAD